MVVAHMPSPPVAAPGAPTAFAALVLTLFPGMFPGPLGASLAGKALKEGRWTLETLDIRSFATDTHRSVDDAPFGGGTGMVLRPDVVAAAVDAGMQRLPADALPVFLTPRGQRLDQALVRRIAAAPGVLLLCGRYEGVDQRVVEARGLMEVSIGDFVLSGGEPAALILLDAVIRLLPGVMGRAESAAEESFEGGLLEYPHYTRPAEWEGRVVPDVLLSGHHGRVAAWRRAEQERITAARRPDLFAAWRRSEGMDGGA